MSDEGSVMSAHGEARVHHHRVQSVAALHLEPQAPLLVSCGFKKFKNKIWTQLRVHGITGAKSGAKASPATWEKSKLSGKATLQSSFRVPKRLLRNLFRFRHRMRGSECSRWT